MSNTSTIRHVPSTLKKEMRKPEDHSFCYRVDQLDYKMANGKTALNRNSKGSHATATQIRKGVKNDGILYQ